MRKFNNSSIYRLFNLSDEKAMGRSCMLASSIAENILSWLTAGAFYTGFLMVAGIDVVKIGIISFVPYIANCFAIFAPSILERFAKRRKLLFVMQMTYYVLNLFATTIMPFIVKGDVARTVCFAVLIFAANIIQALINGGFTAWHINFIPHEIRAEYFSTSSMISSFIGIGTGLISSLLADSLSASPYADTIIYILRFFAVGVAVFDVFMLTKPKEYPYKRSDTKVRLTDVFTKPLKHRRFRISIIVVALWRFVVALSSSYLDFYLLNNVGTSYTFIFILNICYPCTMLLLLKKAQHLINRYGWFRVFGIRGLIYAIPSFMFSLVTANNYIWMLAIVRLSQHVIGVALNTTTANLELVHVPDEDSTNYLSFGTVLLNIATFLGIMLSTWFVGAFPDIRITIAGFEFGNLQLLMWAESVGSAVVAAIALRLRNILDTRD